MRISKGRFLADMKSTVLPFLKMVFVNVSSDGSNNAGYFTAKLLHIISERKRKDNVENLASKQILYTNFCTPVLGSRLYKLFQICGTLLHKVVLL